MTRSANDSIFDISDDRALRDLPTWFSDSVRNRKAIVFIGAGMSVPAGLPLWEELIQDIRKEAGLGRSFTDLPLLCEYAKQNHGEKGDGSAIIKKALHSKLKKNVAKSPTEAHRALARIPNLAFWTSNYDSLIEDAIAKELDLGPDERERLFISRDDQLRGRGSMSPRVIKMNGSMSDVWDDFEPIITRSDFEGFPATHPAIWSRLQSTFLSKSILFLGMSFDDPTIQQILRLSRQLATTRSVSDRGFDHFALILRPPKYKEWAETRQREFLYKMRDLERSGIRVAVVNSGTAYQRKVADLEIKARLCRVFVAGSYKHEVGSQADLVARELGNGLAALSQPSDGRPGLKVVAAAADVGKRVTEVLAKAVARRNSAQRASGPNRRRESKSRFTNATLYFLNQKQADLESVLETSDEFPLMRSGTIRFFNGAADEMQHHILKSVRAMIVIGGAAGTRAEIKKARTLHVPVIPIASTGGSAKKCWQEMDRSLGRYSYGGEAIDRDLFDALASSSPEKAAAAAITLLKKATFGIT